MYAAGDSGEAALPPVVERPPSLPYDEESILMTWLEDVRTFFSNARL